MRVGASYRCEVLSLDVNELFRTAVLAVSLLSDRLYYGFWVFPPFHFLYFNLVQSLATFYGRSRNDYYFTEGLPLLLTTTLPFLIAGILRIIRSFSVSKARVLAKADGRSQFSEVILRDLVVTVVLVIFFLSLVPHKEVRFIYPLLPILLILSAPTFDTLFPAIPFPRDSSRKLLFAAFVLLNLLIAGYVSLVHQRGVIEVMDFVRSSHERRIAAWRVSGERNPTTVAFLMPCHSTPWRSHLVHSGIEAWALTCEPPVNLSPTLRKGYVDEADIFYADPAAWIRENMQALDSESTEQEYTRNVQGAARGDGLSQTKRAWPEYLVVFSQLEPILKEILPTGDMHVAPDVKGQGKPNTSRHYEEVWRGFNSHFHDDWRRRGEVVAFRLTGR